MKRHLPALFDSPPSSLLELGCSNGWLLYWLAKEGFMNIEEYTGIDISPKMIEKAKTR